MAKMQYKVDKKTLRQLQVEINNAIDTATEDSYRFFVRKTPIDKGNARRQTKYRESNNKAIIDANYDYAVPLDRGHSKQAPKGMSGPTLDFLKNILAKGFRKI